MSSPEPTVQAEAVGPRPSLVVGSDGVSLTSQVSPAVHANALPTPWMNREASRTTIDGKASSEGTGPQTVTVTLDGLADDSVRAERWSLAFEPDGETYRLTTALREQRCQPNRGHQTFSANDCV